MKSLFRDHHGLRHAFTVATVLVTAVAFGSVGHSASATPTRGEAPVSQDSAPGLMSLPGDVPGEVKATLGKLEKSSQVFSEKFDQGDLSLTKRLTEHVRRAVESGTITTHLPSGAKFDVASATAYTPKNGEGPSILRLPLAGTNLAKASVLGVTFDSRTGAVVATTEMVISGAENNSAHVTVWNNGVLSLNKIATSEGQVRDTGIVPATTLSAASDGFWERLNDCLAGLGIPWAVVTAIAVACSAACVISAGTGCLLCILAAAGVTQANIAGCVAEASQG